MSTEVTPRQTAAPAVTVPAPAVRRKSPYQFWFCLPAAVIYKQYQAGFYGLSTAGNVVLFVLVTAIVFPLYRFFTRQEVDL